MNDALYEMIYVKKGDFEYFYLSDFSEYEEFETRMYLLLIAGIAGAVLLGIWFGVYSSTKVLKPLSRLTDTMTKQSAADLTAMTPPAGYTDDEIGQLANKFFEYDAALKKIVVRLQTYTANVSHELRNPLFAISGATEILMLDTSQTDENRRTLGRIYQEAHVMGEKIELLLSIAQGSESVAVHEQLDVAAILKNQVNEHEPACLANEVNLSLCIEQEPVVFGTEHALTIILRNVLSNAIRYSGKGKIEVLLNERGIVVEDSGRGVPEEMRNLVFERFFRGPSAQGTEGIGIGLSLVSEVCKAYGWKISVDGARSGSGTRVTLELT